MKVGAAISQDRVSEPEQGGESIQTGKWQWQYSDKGCQSLQSEEGTCAMGAAMEVGMGWLEPERGEESTKEAEAEAARCKMSELKQGEKGICMERFQQGRLCVT